MNDNAEHQISIQPLISYPHTAIVGKTYLMTIDLRPASEDYDENWWPYEKEEYTLHCMLDTTPLFSNKPVGEPTIMLHRFGGTYGPAMFRLTANSEVMAGEIRVTLVNENGIPVEVIPLSDIQLIPDPDTRECFLDTSAVYALLHGTPKMKQAVADAIAQNPYSVSKFVRMEYLREVIIPLIELYFVIKESASADESLTDWSQWFSPQSMIVVSLMKRWLTEYEDYQDKTIMLRRLGNTIVQMVEAFDEAFPDPPDKLSCELGNLSFPRRAFNEDMLLDFWVKFNRIATGIPNCHLCQFRQEQIGARNPDGLTHAIEQQREKYEQTEGYTEQAEWIQKAMTTTETEPSCQWCQRLGDTIIALQAPKTATLVTANPTFVPLTQLLNKDLSLSTIEGKPQSPIRTPHAFISYVRENADLVDQLHQALTDAGVPVWLDRNDIAPGMHLKTLKDQTKANLTTVKHRGRVCRSIA